MAMATIAYLRVSTEGQDLDQQRLAILDYAQKHRVRVDTFVETHRSSQHATQRAELLQMIEGLHPGDRVIVSELSRFGRSLSQILQMIDRLIHKEVRLVAIKEAIHFEGKHNLQTKAMIALFGLFAELERDLIAARTKEGLAAARARGKRLGRPKGALSTSKLDGKQNDIESLLRKKVSKASIARIMEVSQTALHHFIKSRQLQPKTTARERRGASAEGTQRR
jgi:DNA invertase Pin-like site-specific DNA recombinase